MKIVKLNVIKVMRMKKGSRQWGLNPRPSAYKADALPLSYGGSTIVSTHIHTFN